MSVTSSGATVTTYGAYTIYSFLSGTGSLTVSSSAISGVDVLIVGGGAGGYPGGSGGWEGGGGGAGELIYKTNQTFAVGTYGTTVGYGGGSGQNGGYSRLTGLSTTLTANGGGTGTKATGTAQNGGSGGGAGHNGGISKVGKARSGTTGVNYTTQSSRDRLDASTGSTDQVGHFAYSGGYKSSGGNHGGGGGGAGGHGAAGNSTSPGGSGKSYNIRTGSTQPYAGGGGGGARTGTSVPGGSGVGGYGASTGGSGPLAGGNATANTGSGGGGSVHSSGSNIGGSGGSGIIVIRLQLASVPDPPTSVAGTLGDTETTLSWTAPSYPGTTAISGYKIEERQPGVSNWTVNTANTGTTAVTKIITGLTNGATYQYRVSAINSNGTSNASTASSNITPSTPTVPSSPTGISGTANSEMVSLSWTASIEHDDAPVTGYNIQHSTDSGSNWTDSTANTNSNSTAYNATGLTNGTAYIFRIRASSAEGWGNYSSNSASFTPRSFSITATGPAPSTITINGVDHYLHTFSYNSYSQTSGWSGQTSYTVTVSGAASRQVDMLIVGGGGGGGTNFYDTGTRDDRDGAGGGAGGVVLITSYNFPSDGTYYFVVGRGGNPGIYDQLSEPSTANGPDNEKIGVNGLRGKKSYVISAGGTGIALAGTGGGGSGHNGGGSQSWGTGSISWSAGPRPLNGDGNGASGGAARATQNAGTGDSVGGSSWSGSYPEGKEKGGSGSYYSNYRGGRGGGGGAGTDMFGSTPSNNAVNGGTGYTSSFTGSSYTYGKGGDGNRSPTSSAATLGSGGEGYSSGSLNTSNIAYRARKGGDGVIYLRYIATPTVPDPPTNVGGTTGNQLVNLSWTAPSYPGSSAITGYKIELTTDNGSNWSVNTADTVSTAVTKTITGLTNNTTYKFRVSAINTVGTSTASTASANLVPNLSPPDPPTGVSGTVEHEQTTLSWTAPSFVGTSAITGYKIELTTDNGSNWTVNTANTGTTAVTKIVTGLTNLTSYKFRVSAINSDGTSNPSTASDTISPTGNPGDISSNNILLSHLQIAYNQVNNPTDLANPIGLSEFKGCEYIVTTTITVNEGQWTRTTPGSYTWTCPANITSVSVACCGGGGGGCYYSSTSSSVNYPMNGGGGGGLGWKNNISVTPGQNYDVVVGAGGGSGLYYTGTGAAQDGGTSYFISTSTVSGAGGAGGRYLQDILGGTHTGDGGGDGGAASNHLNSYTSGPAGGGGAGGYSGNGGDGRQENSGFAAASGSGGGAGGWDSISTNAESSGGGGVGYEGKGTTGTSQSQGGSGGNAGGTTTSNQNGGNYGGGGGGASSSYYANGGDGGDGFVRIIWGGNRVFPDTNTADSTGTFNVDTDVTHSMPDTNLNINSIRGHKFKNMTPIMTITCVGGQTGANINNGDPTNDTYITLTFTSSEPTSNFVQSDITAPSGTISLFSSTSSTVYTARFTPTSLTNDTDHTISLSQGAYTNNKTTIGCQNNAVQFVWTYITFVGTDIRTSFYEISNRFLNSQTYMNNSGDYNGPYDVGEVQQGYTGNNVRLYLVHKVTAVTTYYNDTPIAAVIHLNASDVIQNSWIFSSNNGGSGSGWQTVSNGISASSTVGTGFTPQTASGYTYGTLYSATTTKFGWATGTGSAYTGAADGIAANTTSFPVGNGTVNQSSGTFYMYRECSGAARYHCAIARSPQFNIISGDKIRVVHALTGPTSEASNIDPDDSIYIGVY